MHDHSDHNNLDTSESNVVEYIKFLLILSAITGIAFLLYLTTDSSGVQEFLRWFMGVFLVVFAGFKLIGYKMFVMMFAGYDLVAKRIKTYSYVYPFIELLLGILFIADIAPTTRHITVLVIMSVGSIGIFQEIYHRRSGIHCACLGDIIKLPLSTVSLVEDVGMAAMALTMLLI